MLVRLLMMVPFVGQLLVVSWRLFWDRRVSIFLKIFPAAAFLYVISPVDPIPDFRFGIGQIDDVIVAGILLLIFVVLAPQRLVSEHARGRRDLSDDDTKTIEGDFRYTDTE